MSHTHTAPSARNKRAHARKFLKYCGELPREIPAKTKAPANYAWCSPDVARRIDLDAEQEWLEKNTKFAAHLLRLPVRWRGFRVDSYVAVFRVADPKKKGAWRVGIVEFHKGEPASFQTTAIGWPDKKGMKSARWVNDCALGLLWCEAEIHPQVGVLLKKLVVPEACTLTEELTVDFA
ncbi:hypothetical protein K3740_00580 [Ruegeria conchae]|uniref:hypothetical protein n=1 Tax=Ruegeria conchae TaxID=981384 RepID=UPI0021A88B3E|nr:hypothetical protein [Ruegeria conchae]UWR03243.1 hypothetical protein K3740_00580 [Ruegeria conchae]